MFGLSFGQIKNCLGILESTPEEKAKSAKTAMLFSEPFIILSNVTFNGGCAKSLLRLNFSSSFQELITDFKKFSIGEATNIDE